MTAEYHAVSNTGESAYRILRNTLVGPFDSGGSYVGTFPAASCADLTRPFRGVVTSTMDEKEGIIYGDIGTCIVFASVFADSLRQTRR